MGRVSHPKICPPLSLGHIGKGHTSCRVQTPPIPEHLAHTPVRPYLLPRALPHLRGEEQGAQPIAHPVLTQICRVSGRVHSTVQETEAWGEE